MMPPDLKFETRKSLLCAQSASGLQRSAMILLCEAQHSLLIFELYGSRHGVPLHLRQGDVLPGAVLVPLAQEQPQHLHHFPARLALICLAGGSWISDVIQADGTQKGDPKA